MSWSISPLAPGREPERARETTLARQAPGRSYRPAGVALLLSLALHAALLAATMARFSSGAAPSEIVRISLLPWDGGGEASEGGPAAGPAETARPQARPVPAAADLPRPSRRRTDRVASVPAPPRPEERQALRRARKESAAPDAPRPAGAAAAPVGGPGSNGGGLGAGPGGAGSGAGSGIGAGAGRGVGRPYCVYCPEPLYPLAARARGWQGTVDVALSVEADGTVRAAEVRRSSGYDVLDRAAVAVARQSRFSLPADGGLPAPLRGRIEYRFELSAAR